MVGVFVAFLAAFLPIVFLAKLVSLGMLLAFTIVCRGVWVLRVRKPALRHPFRRPWAAAMPILGMVVSLALMLSLGLPAWIGFESWLIVGLLIYFSSSRKHRTVRLKLRR